MTERETVCRLALGEVQGLGNVKIRSLIAALGSAAAVFDNTADLRSICHNLPPEMPARLSDPTLLNRAEAEVEWASKHGVDIIIDTDARYPSRLRECEDAPLLIFAKGNVELNPLRAVSIVGTRHATAYGRALCHEFVSALAGLCPGVLVVSGLAYGIDIEAHRAALDAGLPTVAVLAHGLDRLYPAVHRQTADRMMFDGGLLTEYRTGTNPDRQNFVCRNRIVAGLTDATIVVESAVRGGALITASLAMDYGRDCFAFPGRVGDEYSAGCNRFISDNRAGLIVSAEDFVKKMMWDNDITPGAARNVQRNLFVELTPDEQRVVDVLRDKGDMQLNDLVLATAMPVNMLSTIMFGLEMSGVVRVMAGNVYQLLP